MAKKTNGKPKQSRLPGTEDGLIKELVDAADEYVEARDTRMDWNKTEVGKKENLLKLMHKHNLKKYSYEGRKITITDVVKEEIKVVSTASEHEIEVEG